MMKQFSPTRLQKVALIELSADGVTLHRRLPGAVTWVIIEILSPDGSLIMKVSPQNFRALSDAKMIEEIEKKDAGDGTTNHTYVYAITAAGRGHAERAKNEKTR